ncbi:hypothetical protein D3C78_1779560 [compost metagenome]
MKAVYIEWTQCMGGVFGFVERMLISCMFWIMTFIFAAVENGIDSLYLEEKPRQ